MDWQSPKDYDGLSSVYSIASDNDLGGWISELFHQGSPIRHLVDLGGGTGNLLRSYSSLFENTTVLELDDGMSDKLNRNLPSVKVVKADINHFSILDSLGSVSAITACFFVYFIRNFSRFLSDSFLSLEDGGKLVLVGYSKTLWSDSREWQRSACGGVVSYVDEPAWGELPPLIPAIYRSGFSEVRHRVFESTLRFDDRFQFMNYYELTASFCIAAEKDPLVREKMTDHLGDLFGNDAVVDRRYIDCLECIK